MSSASKRGTVEKIKFHPVASLDTNNTHLDFQQRFQLLFPVAVSSLDKERPWVLSSELDISAERAVAVPERGSNIRNKGRNKKVGGNCSL